VHLAARPLERRLGLRGRTGPELDQDPVRVGLFATGGGGEREEERGAERQDKRLLLHCGFPVGNVDTHSNGPGRMPPYPAPQARTLGPETTRARQAGPCLYTRGSVQKLTVTDPLHSEVPALQTW